MCFEKAAYQNVNVYYKKVVEFGKIFNFLRILFDSVRIMIKVLFWKRVFRSTLYNIINLKTQERNMCGW